MSAAVLTPARSLAARPADGSRRLAVGLLNGAHALDHLVILIYPTVVIELAAAYGRSYSELITLGIASFTAFGLFSLPAGWLADRWSRRNMMVVFFFGCGSSLLAAAFAPSLMALAVALFALGIFGSIYHPVATALLLEDAARPGRTLGFNAVCGNIGVALAPGVSAVLTAAFSWRAAFLLPGLICMVAGAAYLRFVPATTRRDAPRNAAAEVALPVRAAAGLFVLLMLIALIAGLVTNTVVLVLPKIVDERISSSVSLLTVGGVTTAVVLCGGLAQIGVGRLVEYVRLHILFVAVAIMQFGGILWAIYASGPGLLAALALTMVAIYGQLTVNDLVIARYTADAWRGRAYAVRYFLTFMVSGVSAAMIAVQYARGGMGLILCSIAVIAFGFLLAVLALALTARGVEKARSSQLVGVGAPSGNLVLGRSSS